MRVSEDIDEPPSTVRLVDCLRSQFEALEELLPKTV